MYRLTVHYEDLPASSVIDVIEREGIEMLATYLIHLSNACPVASASIEKVEPKSEIESNV